MIKDFFSLIKLYRNPIFSGVLIGTSYIPFFPWALLFCLSPLWIFAYQNRENLPRIFLGGFITQFIFSLIGFYWIAIVAQEYGYLPLPVAIFCLILFASVIHLFIPVSLYFVAQIHRRLPLRLGSFFLLIALFTSLSEALWPRLFAWNFGYPLVAIESLGIRQWSDTFGVLGLSLFVLLSNGVIAWVYLQKPKWWGLALTSMAAFWVTLHFTGIQKSHAWLETDSVAKTLVVQANIGNLDKIMAEKGRGFQKEIAARYLELTQLGLIQHPETEFVIWPESALPEFLDIEGREKRPRVQDFYNFVRDTQKQFIVGAYSKDPPTVSNPKDYNSLFFINSDGSPVAKPYRKSHLLVFGEYTPLSQTFPFLAKISPAGEGFGRGQGPMVTQLGAVRWGSQICYESLDPLFSSKLSLLGADILVNVTNDSWFSSSTSKMSWLNTSSEAYQHLEMTLARTLETRRPLVRSTNTGISTAILANGKVLERGPTQSTWYHLFEIPFKKQAPQTFYTQHGHLFSYYLILCVLITLVFGRQNLHSSKDE